MENDTMKYRYLNTTSWNDRWIVEHVFNEKRDGFFVEVGANDGVSYSPTYILEKFLDWSGVLIEPNPIFFSDPSIQKMRSASKCYNLGVSKQDEQLEFVHIHGHKNGYSGFPSINKWGEEQWRQRIQAVLDTQEHNTVTVECRTLDSILRDADAPKVIDYLSLDIEGAEEAALINFPFDEFKFKAVSLESSSFDLTCRLTKEGYFPVINPFCESIYENFFVHSDFIEVRYNV